MTRSIEFNKLDCIIIMKKHGYSDTDLLNILDIPNNAMESGKLSEKYLKNILLLEEVLANEGIFKNLTSVDNKS